MAATSSPKDLAKSFAELIKRARGTTPYYFAVGKDRAGDPAVHVDKKKPNACVAALKSKGTASIFASGRIRLEENVLTLACMKQPNVSTVRRTFALFFKKWAVIIPGGSESAIVVLGPAEWNSAADEDDDTSQAAETPAADTAVESTPPTANVAPNTGLRDELVVAWKQLLPETSKALADAARKATVQPIVAQFQSLVQAGSFEKAKPVLEQLAALLKQGGAPSQGAEDPKARAAALMAEWNQLKPAMTQAAADPARRPRMEALAAQFKQEFQGGKFDSAQKALAGLAELSKAAPKATSANGGGEQDFQKKWTTAKQTWIACMETIDGQINQVAGKMRASNDAGFKRIADQGLPALTENHKTPVMRALFALDGPPSPARTAAATKAKAAIAAFRSHVAASKEMRALDEHSQIAFGVALTLRKEISTGLAALDQALGALEV